MTRTRQVRFIGGSPAINIFRLIATSIPVWFCAMFFSVAVHELSHLLVGVIFGVREPGVYLSFFGTGTMYHYIFDDSSLFNQLMSVAGMAGGLVAGVFVLFVVAERVRGYLPKLFFIHFSFVCILGSIFYLITGVILNYGDGTNIRNSFSLPLVVFVLIGLIAFVVLIDPMARVLYSFLEEYLSMKGYAARVSTFLFFCMMTVLFMIGISYATMIFVVAVLLVSFRAPGNTGLSVGKKAIPAPSFKISMAVCVLLATTSTLYFGVTSGEHYYRKQLDDVDKTIGGNTGSADQYLQRGYYSNRLASVLKGDQALALLDKALEDLKSYEGKKGKNRLHVLEGKSSTYYLLAKQHKDKMDFKKEAVNLVNCISVYREMLKAFPKSDKDNDLNMDMARAYALKGNDKESLERLSRASELGGADYRKIEADKDFEHLKNDREFKSIMMVMRNNEIRMFFSFRNRAK